MKKNIWHSLPQHPEIRFGQYIVPNFVSNTVAIRVSDNEYIIVSPGKSLIDSWPDEWQKNDITVHIIMPNSYHYMGVSAWQTAFPKNHLYASKGAIPKLIKKGVAQSKGDILALEEQLPPLPSAYSILFPPGHRADDIWLKKRDDTTQQCVWITCDSFLTYQRMSNQPFARAMQRILGAAPGLKISQIVKWFILDNRKEFKSWALNQLHQDRPTTLIPSHGEILNSALLYQEIESLINHRL
jgi:hypothetical protein